MGRVTLGRRGAFEYYILYVTTCPRQEVSGNTSGEFVMPADFLPYIL